MLGVKLENVPDLRRQFELNAHFQLDGSLLIRSGFGEQDQGPDTVHLHARHGRPEEGQPYKRQPVISGTSLAGALRGRALRIARTLAGDQVLASGQRRPAPQAVALVNGIFGPDEIRKSKRPAGASRLIVEETPIQEIGELVQNRIRIDRFTGGAFESALFNEQPVFGQEKTDVAVRLTLHNPREAEIGLLLLMLKDLWTGDLTLGGESSVGRGRLRGVEADLKLEPQTGWRLVQSDPQKPVTLLSMGKSIVHTPSTEELRAQLNGYVAALRKELGV